MNEKRTPRTVRLPDPEGGPELDLRGSHTMWEALEEKWGALGGLYLSHIAGHVNFRLCCEMTWRAARNAGSCATLKEITPRCYALGLHRLSEVCDQLWLDVMKPTEPSTDAPEGDAPAVPLASGA